MKKTLLLTVILALFAGLCIMAQKPIERPGKNSERKAMTAPKKSGARKAAADVPKGQPVDLGLPSGIRWSDRNIGAKSPSAPGREFRWSDISTQSAFAKRTGWGGDWRMPTKSEVLELIRNCTWTKGKKDGRNGYTATGPNGNSIFLPANNTSWGFVGTYWTSTPDANHLFDDTLAETLYFASNADPETCTYSRDLKLFVRPVVK